MYKDLNKEELELLIALLMAQINNNCPDKYLTRIESLLDKLIENLKAKNCVYRQ